MAGPISGEVGQDLSMTELSWAVYFHGYHFTSNMIGSVSLSSPISAQGYLIGLVSDIALG